MEKIAVITPYYKEPLETLQQCLRSVAEQNVPADHFMIADGHPNDGIQQQRGVKHVILPHAHADNGNTPRGIGSLLAASEGYDFISYLDADNWFHTGHLSSLLELRKATGSAICTSFRSFHALDGAVMPVEDIDERDLTHVDTSCFLIHKSAFKVLDVWLKMPKVLSPICDRIFFSAILRQGYRVSSTRRKTVAFRSQYKIHYLASGLPPPDGAKENVEGEAHRWLRSVEGVRDVVDRLGFYPG